MYEEEGTENMSQTMRWDSGGGGASEEIIKLDVGQITLLAGHEYRISFTTDRNNTAIKFSNGDQTITFADYAAYSAGRNDIFFTVGTTTTGVSIHATDDQNIHNLNAISNYFNLGEFHLDDMETTRELPTSVGDHVISFALTRDDQSIVVKRKPGELVDVVLNNLKLYRQYNWADYNIAKSDIVDRLESNRVYLYGNESWNTEVEQGWAWHVKSFGDGAAKGVVNLGKSNQGPVRQGRVYKFEAKIFAVGSTLVRIRPGSNLFPGTGGGYWFDSQENDQWETIEGYALSLIHI